MLIFPLFLSLFYSPCFGVVPGVSLESYETGLLTDLKINLQHTLDGARIRRKRQAGMLSNIKDIKSFSMQYFKVGDTSMQGLPYLSRYNLTAWTSLQHMGRQQVFVGTRTDELLLFDVTDTDSINFLSSADSKRAVVKVKAFSYLHEQWFVVLQFAAGQYFIQTYQRKGGVFEERQVLALKSKGDFDLISVRGNYYMIVSTYGQTTLDHFSYESETKLYEWSTTQFDKIDQRSSFGANSVTSWTFDGVLYFAVAQEVDNSKNYHIGSPVYMFNSMAGSKFRLIGQLKTNASTKVAHFSVSGNQYLLVAGGSDAVIYWWSSGQFLVWQELDDTSGASDIAILTLQNGEVILVIVMKAEISFLTLDATGHYVVTFTMQIESSKVTSLQFMFDGRDFYALAMSDNFADVPNPIWKLKVVKDEMPDITAIDGLVQCLSLVDDLVAQRRDNLEQTAMELNRVWVQNRPMVVSASVTVNGIVSTPDNVDSIVDEIIISSNETFDITPLKLNDAIRSFDGYEQVFYAQLEDVSLKSKKQRIYGTTWFKGAITVPSLKLPHVDDRVTINGVEISRLATQALKKSNNLPFTSNIWIKELYADELTAHWTNGISTEDVVLLHGSSDVTGFWKFSNVSFNNLVARTLNNVDMQELITQNSDQVIMDTKSFRHLKAFSLSSDLMNGENLKDVENNAVTLDSDQMIPVSINFDSKIKVSGLIRAFSINQGLSLELLDTDSVKRSTVENIAGIKTFTSPVHVSEDISLRGLLNNVDLHKDIVTTETKQIFGDIDFVEPLMLTSLKADTINNMIHGDAFLPGVDNAIGGHKLFTSIFTTNELHTSNGARINGVDLAADVELIIKHQDGIVFGPVPEFHNVNVRGDIVAYDGVNGFLISDIPSKFWLKSHPQVINQTFLGAAGFDLNVENSFVNGLSLQHDIFHVNGGMEFHEKKLFQQDIQVEEIRMDRESYFNGLQLRNFDIRELENYINMPTGMITGNKIMPAVDVQGSIITDTVNGLDLSRDILLANAIQRVPGTEHTFANVFTSEKLRSTKLDIQRIEDLNFAEFAAKAVMVNNANLSAVSNKIFVDIQGYNMFLTGDDYINDINFNHFYIDTIKLDNSEYVTGVKTFTEIHAMNPIVATLVNDLELKSLIDDVVFLDVPGIISNKNFLGHVAASDLFTNSINMLNLTKLVAESWSKTGNNDITALISFGLAFFDRLYTPSVNGIPMTSLVRVGEDEELDNKLWFLEDVFANSQVFVTGLANGCSLNDVANYALRTNYNGVQYFMDGAMFLNMTIDGNVHVRNHINGIVLDDLVNAIIGSHGIQEVVGDFFIHPGIVSTNFNLRGLLNATDLQYIMGDAVVNTLDQIIDGYKIFHKDLVTTVVYGDMSTNVIGNVNDVDFNSLLAYAVTKSGYEEISGGKTFQNVEVGNVTVLGYINTIKLPRDVILSKNTEYIADPVVILSDVQVQSDLTVEGIFAPYRTDFTSADGTDLNEFLANIVTLVGIQDIYSDLTFHDPATIRGVLNVRGLLNNLDLNLAVTVSGSLTISGTKSFSNTLQILNNLDALTVNTVDVQHLYNAIFRVHASETINSLSFTQGIFLQNSISVGSVNGIDPNVIKKAFHDRTVQLNSTLTNYRNLGFNQSQLISSELTEIKKQILQFAYFVLHKEFNFGPAIRLLNGPSEIYENYMLHSMVMWTIRTYCLGAGRCCDVPFFYLLSVDNDATVTRTSGPTIGRYFPLVLTGETTSAGFGQNLGVWTNATTLTSDWCPKGPQQTVVETSEDGLSSVHLKIDVSSSPVAISSFFDVHFYLVIAFNLNSWTGEYAPVVVYRRSHPLSGKWEEHQTLPVYGTSSMDQVTFSSGPSHEILLALGTSFGTYPASYSSVYGWNFQDKRFDLMQQISSQHVHSIRWIEKDPELLLAVASLNRYVEDGRCNDIFEGGYIDIYRYSNQLTLVQTLPLPGVASMVSFTINEEIYLAANSRQLRTVVIYHWQGFNAFKPIQNIEANDVTHLNFFWRQEQLYLTMSSGSGPSKILKSVSRGQQRFTDPYAAKEIEVNDEPSKPPNC